MLSVVGPSVCFMTIAPARSVTAADAVVGEIVWDAAELGGLLGQIAMGYQLRETPLRGATTRLSEPDLIEAFHALARTRAAVERIEVELVREALTRGLPQNAALSAINWIRTTEGGQVPPPDAAHAARVARIATAATTGPGALTERTIASFFAGGLSATKTDQVLRLVTEVTKVTDANELAEVVEALRAGSIDGPDPLPPLNEHSNDNDSASSGNDSASASASAGDRSDHPGHDSRGSNDANERNDNSDSDDPGGRADGAGGPDAADGAGWAGTGPHPVVPSWVSGMAPDPDLPWTMRTSTGPTGWGLSSRDLGTAIRYTRRMLKPANLLAEEAATARRGRALHALPGPGGLTDYQLTVDAEGAALIDAAVSALSRPRPTGPDGRADLPTPAHRRADALLEIVQRGLNATTAATSTTSTTGPGTTGTGRSSSGSRSGGPGQPRAQVVVTIGLSDLLAQTNGAGITATGQVLTPDAVRRIACDAQIIPMVLGGKSQPLDVGRAERFFTNAQRTALFQRDRHCTYPGCTIPAQWCDAHHLTPWAHGGRTDLNVGALLCRLHHSYAHDHHLTATVTTMGVRWSLRT